MKDSLQYNLFLALGLFTVCCYAGGSGLGDDDCVRLDAAVRYDGVLYLFNGDQYLETGNLYENSTVLGNVTEWDDLPADIDAAVQYAGNYQHYFFKGSQYYRYTLGFLRGPFDSAEHWNSFFADGIDASATLDEESFFFKGCYYIKAYRSWGRTRYSEPSRLPDNLPCDIDAAWDLETFWSSMVLAKNDQVWIWSLESITGPSPLSDFYSTQPWNLCTTPDNSTRV
ncbi:uncharacterized protein LOC101858171 isoform X2 [Aplysia californica]|nr:uncharacterized protein LOC101858171 isoform X2 [Aplysia californica]